MKTRKLAPALLSSMMLLIGFFGVACAPGPTAAPIAAFDMQATLDKHLSNLPDGWGMISPTALNEQLQSTKPFVVDVREAKEVTDAGFIPGAINIPIRSFLKNLDKLPAKNQPIIVTCGSGHRSALGMEALQLLGYANVKSLAGGLNAWKAANLPIVMGSPPEAKAGHGPDVDMNLLAALDKHFSNLPDGWSTIAPVVLKNLLAVSKPFQVDVRETEEIAEGGSIAGATSIPIRALLKNLAKLPPDKGAPIIAECSNGHRSAMTLMALNLLGYTNVTSLAGGLSAWTKAGLPVSK